jgi:atypical dual specificity phosphatase
MEICPEDTFTNEEWLEAINNSHDLQKEYTTLSKFYLNYKAALNFNLAMNFLNLSKASIGELLGKDWQSGWNWWDEVFTHPETGAKLFLGALPLAKEAFGITSRNDLETLQNKHGVKAVLSLVEVFENTSEGIITSPITPEDWEKAGILQLQVATPDFETMSISQLLRVAAFIDWNLREGRSVYVHCKAGRGRSKLGVDAYLLKYQHLSAKDAYNYVKMKRPQAGYHGAKWDTLIEFENQFGEKHIKGAIKS